MSFLPVKVYKTVGGKDVWGKERGQNCDEVVSWWGVGDQDLGCATARQMSASLIKLDFRPVLRESNKHI
jgi:hypothetical protein